MRSIFLALVLIASLTLVPLQVIAQDECTGNLKACTELLDECAGAECPPAIDCEKICEERCGWVSLVKDKTFMAAVLGSIVFLVGGIAGIFVVPSGA